MVDTLFHTQCGRWTPFHQWVSEYCFTSLSAQSWQYRDKWKPYVATVPYSYRMTSRVLYSAQYYRQHCTLQAFEQFGALYRPIRNPNDKHPTQPGFEPSTSEFWATIGSNEPSGPATPFHTQSDTFIPRLSCHCFRLDAPVHLSASYCSLRLRSCPCY